MNEQSHLSRRKLAGMLISRALIVLSIMMVLILIPAGTLNFWQAWMLLLTLVLPSSSILVYFLFREPDLLERRMRFREKRAQQKKIIYLSYPVFLLTFILPGLDFRLGWSHMPPAVCVFADGVVLLAYCLFVMVIHENRYAGRTVVVDAGQTVITTGPYALIRHPMYVATTLMYVSIPLALGSYWSVLAAIWLIPFLVARILDEEKALIQDLPGYLEYTRRVRYRMLPGIW